MKINRRDVEKALDTMVGFGAGWVVGVITMLLCQNPLTTGG